MRKIYIIAILIASLFAFSACSHKEKPETVEDYSFIKVKTAEEVAPELGTPIVLSPKDTGSIGTTLRVNPTPPKPVTYNVHFDIYCELRAYNQKQDPSNHTELYLQYLDSKGKLKVLSLFSTNSDKLLDADGKKHKNSVEVYSSDKLGDFDLISGQAFDYAIFFAPYGTVYMTCEITLSNKETGEELFHKYWEYDIKKESYHITQRNQTYKVWSSLIYLP